MGNLFNALNGLKTNIFGGGNTGKTTPILRRTAIGINDESPVSKLDHDPFQYSSIQYPRDLTSTGGIGHYMLFYVNVQDKTKYTYTDTEGKSVRGWIEVPITETRTRTVGYGPTNRTEEYEVVVGSKFVQEGKDDSFNYFKDLNGRGNTGSLLGSDGIEINKTQREAGSGIASVKGGKTTRRITDSVAIYLPPNVTDSTSAAYNGFATGGVGSGTITGTATITPVGVFATGQVGQALVCGKIVPDPGTVWTRIAA